MAIPLPLLIVAPAIAQLIRADPAAVLEQRHLGRKVMPLQEFNPPLRGVSEADVIDAPTSAGAMQPDAVHDGGPDVSRFWRVQPGAARSSEADRFDTADHRGDSTEFELRMLVLQLLEIPAVLEQQHRP